jgi:hypothetical protein
MVSDQPDAHYDLFMSYADADRSWVEGFLLPALGLSPGPRHQASELSPWRRHPQ